MELLENGLDLWRDINPGQRLEQLKKKQETESLSEEEIDLFEFLAACRDEHESYEVQYIERMKNLPIYEHFKRNQESFPRPYYGYNGQPIKMWEYLALLRFRNGCALTMVKDYCVSTVWLGLDHNVAAYLDIKNYRPHIFETMVFYEGSGEAKENIQEIMQRYPTLDEAFSGHEEVVDEVKRLLEKEE